MIMKKELNADAIAPPLFTYLPLLNRLRMEGDTARILCSLKVCIIGHSYTHKHTHMCFDWPKTTEATTTPHPRVLCLLYAAQSLAVFDSVGNKDHALASTSRQLSMYPGDYVAFFSCQFNLVITNVVSTVGYKVAGGSLMSTSYIHVSLPASPLPGPS